MVFKNNWEKESSKIAIAPEMIEAMAGLFQKKGLDFFHVIDGGCANLNVKIKYKNDDVFYILRIYLKKKNAAALEYNIAKKFHDKIPIAKIYFQGRFDDYDFSIMEYLSGITLRDLLLSNRAFDLDFVMYDVGYHLSRLSQITFEKAGTFSNDLMVEHFFDDDFLTSYLQSLLNSPNTLKALDDKAILRIKKLFDIKFFTQESSICLVHGDFDPANVLVFEAKDGWRVSGILDWEFSHTNSAIVDVANMLRYADKMPQAFQSSFLKGFEKGGGVLEEHWQTQVRQSNMIALLDLLSRTSISSEPKKFGDIYERINYFS